MRIVTDSTVDLPKEMIASYGIEIVPLKVQLGEDVYRDYYDIDPDDYYHKLRSTALFPTTTQPSPQDFVETYQRLGKNEDCLISLLVQHV